MSVASRVASAMAAAAVGRGINILVQVVGVPLFISLWGVNIYGQWLMLTAIPSYLTALDFGLAAAAANAIAIKVAQGDARTARVIFDCSLGFIILVGTGVLMAAMAIVALIDPGALLLDKENPIPHEN